MLGPDAVRSLAAERELVVITGLLPPRRKNGNQKGPN